MDLVLIASRAVQFAACLSLAGIFAFDGLIAPLGRRLPWLAWASLALALVSGAGWLAGVAANMSGEPLGEVISHGVLVIVLTETRFGADWLLRAGIAVLLALVLALWPRARRALTWAGLGLGLVLLASLAWAGHGAATMGAQGNVQLAGDILHLVGAGVWLGSLLPLALYLAAVRRGGDWAAARPAMRRYSALAIASVAVLLAGGVSNTIFLAGTIPALVGTEYGRLLLVKIALFVAMLFVAAVNLLRLTPRLRAARGADRTVAQLRRNALVEATIGCAAVAVVGALGILPPAIHTEPVWPFPFRFDLAAVSAGARAVLAMLGAGATLALVAAAAALAAGHYRRAAAAAVALALCGGALWLALEPAIAPATPTSFSLPDMTGTMGHPE